MKELQVIETVDALFVFAWLFLTYGVSIYINEDRAMQIIRGHKAKTEVFQERPIEPVRPKLPEETYCILNAIEGLDIYYDSIEYEYIGSYFITAYCPHECGYVEYSDGTDNFPRGWTTASGTICHYSDSNFEPTTCAIDRRYFGFEEYIAVDFDGELKTYVTEDTGAFSGRWIDCFVETMYEVETWQTGWKDCYSVEFTTNNLSSHFGRKVQRESINNYLHYRCFGFWLPDRNDVRDFRRFRRVQET